MASDPEAQFQKRSIDLITSDNEAVRFRLDKTEQTVARLADAVEQQAANISN